MSFLQHNTWSGLHMDSYCPLSNPFLTWFASVPYYHEAKFLGKSSTFLVLVQLHVIVHVHMFLQCAISQHHSWHWCLVLIKYYKIKNDTPVCQILWFGLGMRPLLCLILNFVKVFDNNVLHIYQLRIFKAKAHETRKPLRIRSRYNILGFNLGSDRISTCITFREETHRQIQFWMAIAWIALIRTLCSDGWEWYVKISNVVFDTYLLNFNMRLFYSFVLILAKTPFTNSLMRK